MDLVIVFYIVGAFIVGIILTCLFKKAPKTDSVAESLLLTLEEENAELKNKLDSFKAKNDELSDSSRKVEEVKIKYENLLKEANAQCEKLEQQLKCAMEGKLDNNVKEQLVELDKLKKKIKNLEEEIEENEDDISDLKKKIGRAHV